MRKVFIADAHLRLPGDDNYRTLLRFLAELPGSTDTLYILGDLFEFWIGYQQVAFSQYLPLLDALLALRRAGVEIVYFEGNHDFHMGPYFTHTLGARVYRGPAVLEVEGKRVYLCHGDEINRRDYAYRMLRLLLHSPLTSALTRVVPPRCASAIADRLGRKRMLIVGALLMVLAGLTFAYGVVIRRYLDRDGPWRDPVRRITVTFGGAALGTLVLALVSELWTFQPGQGAPVDPPQTAAVAG